MIKNLELTNGRIYDLAALLLNSFNEDVVLPVKISFYLQKNMSVIVELGKEIEKSRLNILDQYGSFDEETQQYTFEKESAEKATSELQDLMELTQVIPINVIRLDSFEGIELTGKQTAAISFMIEE